MLGFFYSWRFMTNFWDLESLDTIHILIFCYVYQLIMRHLSEDNDLQIWISLENKVWGPLRFTGLQKNQWNTPLPFCRQQHNYIYTNYTYLNLRYIIFLDSIFQIFFTWILWILERNFFFFLIYLVMTRQSHPIKWCFSGKNNDEVEGSRNVYIYQISDEFPMCLLSIFYHFNV